MHLIYIDDSRDESLCVFSALAIPAEKWKGNFKAVKDFRVRLKEQHGIFMRAELHATDLVAGRGRISGNAVFKGTRCRIFHEAIQLTASLDSVRLFNSCMEVKKEPWAFERLLNRINRTMKAWGSRALILSDAGKESEYTRLCRKMGVYNPIPSRFGEWPDGKETKNIPLEYVVEDPIFKDSRRSYFVQLADLCAFALLRRENQIPSRNRYGIHQAFDQLDPILVKEANGKDAQGIIR